MSQVIYDTIDPNITSGTQLAAILNDFKDALVSNQSGAARPSEIDPGGQWLKTVSATQWELYIFDGTDDILVYTINPTANNIKFPGSADTFDLTRQSADSIGPILSLIKLRDTGATQVNDELGVIDFKGHDGTTEYTQARVKAVSLDITSATEQGADFVIETTDQDANALLERIRVKGSGLVGIGTETPEKQLHVKSTGANAGVVIERDQDATVDGPIFSLKKIRGVTDNGQTKLGDLIGKYVFTGTTEAGVDADLAQVVVEATEDTSTGAQGSKLTIKTKSNGATAFTDNITIEDGVVTINGAEQGLDVKSSAALLDDTVTRNLFSIDGTIYKAFDASVHLWGSDTVGPTTFAQEIKVTGVYDGSTWHLTWDDKDLAGNGLLVELSETNAATLVIDYVNQIASADFNTGNIYLNIVRKK